MDARTPMMRARHYSERAITGVGRGQIAEASDLRGLPPIAHRMIPAPPILMPRQRGTLTILDTDVPGYPFEILGSYGLHEDAEVSRRGQEELDDGMILAQRQQRIVRARASGCTLEGCLEKSLN
jgi:hypothetical protein